MPYPLNSRYHALDTTTRNLPDGREQVYLKRRWVPQPERFVLLQTHPVVAGDRLDNLAARYLGDPEQFWRICDANRALDPEALTERAGRVLRITLPEGITGAPLV